VIKWDKNTGKTKERRVDQVSERRRLSSGFSLAGLTVVVDDGQT
jgi:hypothetical protein